MIMVDLGLNDKIIDLIRREGPVLPVKITKLMNTNILMASAKLSELVSKKIVKISNTKIGGSPVYYLIGQENKLEMLYDYLAEKEKEAYNFLKEKKVLKDSDCEPGIRVALRNIKDFAVGFTFNDELFWKWFLIFDDEVMGLVKGIMDIKEEKTEKVKEKAENEKEIKFEKKETKIETHDTMLSSKQLAFRKPKEAVHLPLIKLKKPKIAVKKKSKEDEFLVLVNDYIKHKKYNVVGELDGKKNKEVYKIISVGSDLGELKYLLFAKNKKKINDSDLRLAYGKGQEKKIPVLFASNGGLSKKAENYLAENSFIIFEKI